MPPQPKGASRELDSRSRCLPVSDSDRAIAFYRDQVGFTLDHHTQNEHMNVAQLTPPGSACSIVMGTGTTEMPPGSQKGLQMVVADAAVARQQLIDHGGRRGT